MTNRLPILAAAACLGLSVASFTDVATAAPLANLAVKKAASTNVENVTWWGPGWGWGGGYYGYGGYGYGSGYYPYYAPPVVVAPAPIVAAPVVVAPPVVVVPTPYYGAYPYYGYGWGGHW